MSDLEKVKCNYCESDNYKIRYVKNGYNIVQCKKCGLVYVNPRLKQKAINELYDEKYFHGGGFDQSVEYEKEFDEKRNKIDLTDWDVSSIKELIRTGTPPEDYKIIDVGCGMGLFLEKARQKGFSIEGLELSKYACGFVESKGLSVQNASIYDAELRRESYDAVSITEVIEHLPDPKIALKKIYDSLKPGGVMFLTTGNYNCPERRVKGKDWSYFMPEGHVYIFSNKSIKRYLNKIGFRKVIVTNQGDLLMDLLLKYNFIDPDRHEPKNIIRRMGFKLVRFINHFISSGLRVYAIK